MHDIIQVTKKSLLKMNDDEKFHCLLLSNLVLIKKKNRLNFFNVLLIFYIMINVLTLAGNLDQPQ